MSVGRGNLSSGTFLKKVNWETKGRPRVLAAAAQGLNLISGPSVQVILPRLAQSVSCHSSPAPLK